MASTGTIYNPVGPDWRLAQAAADRRCRSWGYAGAGSFAGWQEAWSAEPVVVNRGVKAAVLKLKHFAASVIGGATPSELARALKGADDGFAARFLFAWPAPTRWVTFGERFPPVVRHHVILATPALR